MTTIPRPAQATEGPGPPPGAHGRLPRPSAARPHILVVNGRKVRNPVFVIGAPLAGTEMLARAVKRSPGST